MYFFSSSVFSQTAPAVQQQEAQLINSFVSFIQNLYSSISSFFIFEKKEPVSAKFTQEELQDSILFQSLSAIKEQIPPFFYDKYAIFTFFDKSEKSSVYLISSLNNYKELIPLVRLESNKKILALLFPRSSKKTVLQYRLVINGVWGYDTSNPNTVIDPNGITLSTITIPVLPKHHIPSYIPLSNNLVRFVFSPDTHPLNLRSTSMQYIYTDISNARAIYINANFTGWDPLLIKMQHNTILGGVYVADIQLSPGTHYYYFQAGNTSFLDPKNSDIVRLKNGMYANKIIVKL